MTVVKALPQNLIANLLADYKKPEDLVGENGLFKPQLICKHQTRWSGFDDKFLSRMPEA